MSKPVITIVAGVMLCGLLLCACATAATLFVPALNSAADQAPAGASVSVVSKCNGLFVVGSCNTSITQTQEQAPAEKAETKEKTPLAWLGYVGLAILGFLMVCGIGAMLTVGPKVGQMGGGEQ